MIKAFTAHIQNQKLFTKNNTILVALSGGADSMALCSLLKEAGYSFSVAHCNFTLRGKEADADEKFVINYCKKNNITYFTKKFKTSIYAENKGISIQMAARELRYTWFNELITQHNFDYLLTAHHANDNVETFLINMLRGSGINGLKAIVAKKGNIIRPLLYATRAEIEAYVAKNKILYREDSSNNEDKYLRNYLRLKVIPALKKLNPSLEKTITTEIDILQQANLIVQKEVEKQQQKLLIKDDNTIKINIAKLLKTTAPQLILFELIKGFDFNTSQANNIYSCLQAQAGKVFESHTHTILKDRTYIIIKKKEGNNPSVFLIPEGTTGLEFPIKIKIEFIDGNINSIAKNSFTPAKAFIDADKITFPLLLNKWQTGDKFKPLGMQGFKKVSDFFTAEKATLFEKQNQWILRCENNIIWLVGKRVDDRFKVTTDTKKICVISIT